MSPDAHSFPGQQADEEISVYEHRHWLFLLGDILIGLVLALVPVAVLIGLNALEVDLTVSPGQNIVAVFLPLYYFGLATWFFIRWLDYYLDLAIVTDQRVVDVDQHGLFKRNIAELKHDVVQDVSVNKAGILQTLLNFGDVMIQTAGERENFTFRTVPRPEDIAQKISDIGHDKEAEEKDATEAVAEAAEKMGEVAEKLDPEATTPAQPTDKTTPPAEPVSNDSPAPSPPPAGAESDLPREYER